MRKLMRYFRENKRKLLTIIGLLAFAIFIVHFMNTIVANNRRLEETNNSSYSKTDEQANPTKVIMDNGEISKETAENNGQIIKQFVEYCNQKKYQEAFQILSTSCQKEIFNNDINLFIQDYVNKIFNTNKIYDVLLWTTYKEKYTYQIKYYENNLLATGESTTSNNIEDYITIIKENNENRLNIKNFISYEEINKTLNKNDIEITIHNRKIYKTYEKYNITIKNNSANTISISEDNNEQDIQLVDENDITYSSLIYEIPQHFLNIKSKYQSNIDLSFNKMYNVDRKVKNMQFNSIILNYDNYINNRSEKIESEIISIKI